MTTSVSIEGSVAGTGSASGTARLAIVDKVSISGECICIGVSENNDSQVNYCNCYADVTAIARLAELIKVPIFGEAISTCTVRANMPWAMSDCLATANADARLAIVLKISVSGDILCSSFAAVVAAAKECIYGGVVGGTLAAVDARLAILIKTPITGDACGICITAGEIFSIDKLTGQSSAIASVTADARLATVIYYTAQGESQSVADTVAEGNLISNDFFAPSISLDAVPAGIQGRTKITTYETSSYSIALITSDTPLDIPKLDSALPSPAGNQKRIMGYSQGTAVIYAHLRERPYIGVYAYYTQNGYKVAAFSLIELTESMVTPQVYMTTIEASFLERTMSMNSYWIPAVLRIYNDVYSSAQPQDVDLIWSIESDDDGTDPIISVVPYTEFDYVRGYYHTFYYTVKALRAGTATLHLVAHDGGGAVADCVFTVVEESIMTQEYENLGNMSPCPQPTETDHDAAGCIYKKAGSFAGKFTKYAADGTTKIWDALYSKPSDPSTLYYLMVYSFSVEPTSGEIYVGYDDAYIGDTSSQSCGIAKLNPGTGKIIWRVDTGSFSVTDVVQNTSSVVATIDVQYENYLVAATHTPVLIKLNKNGTIEWQLYMFNSPIFNFKALDLDSDGSIYVIGRQNNTYALSADGTTWVVVALQPDDYNILYKLDSNGNVVWKRPKSEVWPSLGTAAFSGSYGTRYIQSIGSVIGNGEIIVAIGGVLRIIDSSTGNTLWTDTSQISNPGWWPENQPALSYYSPHALEDKSFADNFYFELLQHVTQQGYKYYTASLYATYTGIYGGDYITFRKFSFPSPPYNWDDLNQGFILGLQLNEQSYEGCYGVGDTILPENLEWDEQMQGYWIRG